jgi:deazaflavin-dependent oxidoreductase (nitroreductase family)
VAKQYVVDGRVRLFAGLMRVFTRLGISGRVVMMTTRGRHSGEARTIPISPIEVGGRRYVVSPYGQRGWVHNVRANPSVELRRGSSVKRAVLAEVTPGEAVPVLQAYYARETITRPYFAVPADPTPADFAAVAGSHPVFAVHPASS